MSPSKSKKGKSLVVASRMPYTAAYGVEREAGGIEGEREMGG